MNIHEHQAKGLLKKFGVSVPDGYPAFTVEEAINNAKKLPGPVYVVKAQILAGGRGKAGGVKVVKNIEEVKKASDEILGKVLVTPQTGPKGKKVQRLYIEDGCQIDKEFYFSILVDRNAGCISIISSTALLTRTLSVFLKGLITSRVSSSDASTKRCFTLS